MPSVLLVDNSPVILKAVPAMLLQYSAITVVGAVLPLAEAIQVNDDFHPDVTVPDLNMTVEEEPKRRADEFVGDSKTVVLMNLLPDLDMKPLPAATTTEVLIAELSGDEKIVGASAGHGGNY
jgi:DNA-binding NarL/FixJ family response regulator